MKIVLNIELQHLKVMTISDFFEIIIKGIKRKIEEYDEEDLLNTNADELTAYFSKKYSLPLIEKDETREVYVEKGRASYGRVPLKVYYPIKPNENLFEVFRHHASTRFMSGFSLEYLGDWITIDTEMDNNKTLETAIEQLEEVIGWKNNDVNAGNSRINIEINSYIKNKHKILKEQYDKLENIVNTIKIPLIVKKKDALPKINLTVKEELKPLLKPQPKKRRVLVLDREKVLILVGHIHDSCLSFEKTPKAFTKFEEEDLRDVILSNLNAIFRGDATGETFSKLGKTDIHLIISEGNILIIECKNWDGKKNYLDAMDQLFRYLTWRENYGILITFSKRKGFTEIIRKCQESAQEHKTFIAGSLKEEDSSMFVTYHTFPEDSEKKVELWHLIFNLYSES